MRLFVSYSHRDMAFVDRLIDDLKQQGFDIWIDYGAIEGGDAWRKSIVKGIVECDAFVIVLSRSSTASLNVIKEISIAEEKRRHIFPVFCETCEIPEDMLYQLAGVQHLDLCGNNYPTGLGRLVSALKRVEGPGVSTPPASHAPSYPSPPASPIAETFPPSQEAASYFSQPQGQAHLPPTQPPSSSFPAQPSQPVSHYPQPPSQPFSPPSQQFPQQYPTHAQQPSQQQPPQQYPPYSQPAPQGLSFQQQLIGLWQVQVVHPVLGVVLGAGQFTFAPNGEFSGGLTLQQGQIQAAGRWQLMGQQLIMQGSHVLTAMPYNVMPYALGLQVVSTGPAGFAAVSTAGEQVLFQKLG